MAFDRKRSATSGRFVCEIDGHHAAYCKEVSGGDREAEIATHDLGPDNVQMKQVANIKYSAFKAKFGIAQGGPMNDWIKASFAKASLAKAGSVTAAGYDYDAIHRIDFTGAYITTVTCPKLDGAAKEAAYIDVEWEAQEITHSPGSGKVKGDLTPAQKTWTPAMFSFTLSGLEDACKRISTIDSFSWKQGVTRDSIGEMRMGTLHPTKLTVPDLKIAFSSGDADPWLKWAKSWFEDGKCTSGDHKEGAIHFLAPDKSEIGTIDLKGVGLKKLSAPSLGANKEEIARHTVELYVEEMKFNMSGK